MCFGGSRRRYAANSLQMFRHAAFWATVTYLMACAPPQTVSPTTTFFEGQLVYACHTSYHGSNPAHRDYYEHQKFGDTLLVTTAADGAYRRDYPYAGPRGYDFTLYRPAGNVVYAAFNFMDTVLAYCPDTTPLAEQRIRRLTHAELDCTDCGGLLLTGRDVQAGLDVMARFTYRDDGPAVNTAAWARNRDFAIGELFAMSGRHWETADWDFGNYRVVVRLARTTPGPVADDVFELPTGRPVKWD